ncbi:MAG: DUF222 domain-containing protein [Ilumatobacter sp.]
MSEASSPTQQVDPDLDAELGEIAGQLNVLNARLVEVAERVIASDEGSRHGMRTPAHYLAWRLGLSPERARQIVRVAEHRRSFPTIIGVFERGELALEQVAEVVKTPAWADAQLLDIAKISTVTKLRRAMRSTMFDGEPDPPDETVEPPPAPTPPVDRLSFGVTEAGRWRLNGDFGLETGRRIEAELTERKDARFADGDETVTWADALTDCCARSLDTIESPSRRDHYRTWIHLDVTSGQATTTDGWHIPMAIEQHLLCDGIIQAVWERDGIPSQSVAATGSCQTAPAASSNAATGAVGYRAAPATGTSRSTTSGTGSTAEQPTPRTSSASARNTTNSTTAANSASPGMPTSSTASCSPTVVAHRSPEVPHPPRPPLHHRNPFARTNPHCAGASTGTGSASAGPTPTK